MTDAEMKARELELRERELKLEEHKAERARRASFLDWVKGLALPIASLIASLFFFGVQQQQQAFERALGNVREGLKLYYQQVGEIERSQSDARLTIDLATDVFGSTIRIYPEVYCSARADLLERIASAPMSVADQKAARRKVVDHPRPNTREGLGSPRWHFVTTMFEPTMPPCEAPKAETEENHNTQAPAASAPVEAAAPAPSEIARGAPAPPAPEPVAEEFRASQVYRLFVQIGSGGAPASVDAWRTEAAAAGFTMSRGVEQVGRPIKVGTVRYNGNGPNAAATKADAEQLAAWLSARTGAPISAIDIGNRFPDMRSDFLEVWMPDQAPPSKRPPPPPQP